MAFKTIPIKSLSGNSRIERRFMKYVHKAENGCWLWTGAKGKNRDGTYRAHFNLRPGKSASRVSYALFKGTIPPKALVLHSCDNGMCVAPEHLRLGTHKENTAEMLAKGRGIKGRKFPNAPRGYKRPFMNRVNKLTDEQVRGIRFLISLGEDTSKQIAKRFNISLGHFYSIKSGKRKAHIK